VKGGKMENNIIQQTNNVSTQPVAPVPLMQRLNQLENAGKVIKTKDMKLIRKSKVNKRKIKKGWVGVLRIDENGNISGEKQKVEDMTVKLKDGTYHATDGREILFWEGKFPVVFQPNWMANPIQIRKDIPMNNETYGQKYIMARMLKDAIVLKNKGSMSIIIWILIIGAAIFGIKYFMGK
jgi:hypothetical protein